MPACSIVAARDLFVGDRIGIDFEPGEWVIESIFFERPHILVLELLRDNVFTCDWHVGLDYEVLRAPRQ